MLLHTLWLCKSVSSTACARRTVLRRSPVSCVPTPEHVKCARCMTTGAFLQVIYAIKKTGVADALGAGPKTADELSKELGAFPRSALPCTATAAAYCCATLAGCAAYAAVTAPHVAPQTCTRTRCIACCARRSTSACWRSRRARRRALSTPRALACSWTATPQPSGPWCAPYTRTYAKACLCQTARHRFAHTDMGLSVCSRMRIWPASKAEFALLSRLSAPHTLLRSREQAVPCMRLLEGHVASQINLNCTQSFVHLRARLRLSGRSPMAMAPSPSWTGS